MGIARQLRNFSAKAPERGARLLLFATSDVRGQGELLWRGRTRSVWQKSFKEIEDLAVPAWRIHQKIGLDGSLLSPAIGLELGRRIGTQACKRLDDQHKEIMKELLPKAAALPGAVELLQDLRHRKVPHGIATSGARDALQEPLNTLGIPKETVIVCADDVKNAKPEPDLFLLCSERLGVVAPECFAIGDAV
jgi:HAD superfamily hydrolase (TIGR01549 family)